MKYEKYYYYTGYQLNFLNKLREKFGCVFCVLGREYYKEFDKNYDKNFNNSYKNSLNKTYSSCFISINYCYYNTSKKQMVYLDYLNEFGEKDLSKKSFKKNFKKFDDENINLFIRKIKIKKLDFC